MEEGGCNIKGVRVGTRQGVRAFGAVTRFS